MSQITTHVLDTALGQPADGLALSLAAQDGDDWRELAMGTTNSDGRVADLCSEGQTLEAGTYRMRFHTGDYQQNKQQAIFYPLVDIYFAVDASGDHYHIPLLLSPFGYSTYRGS